MYKKLFSILILLSIFIGACTNSTDKNEIEDFEDSISTDEQLEFDVEQTGEIVQNFSSPVEMAALIKDAGVPFSKEILSPTDDSDRFNTNFKRAIALGILGVDLGYLNIYARTSHVVNYVTLIKKIAEEMKVGQFFDFATLKRLASNSASIDSLMYLSTSSFNRMDTYLRKSERGNLSALIVSGVWIEGLYLASQVVKEKPNEEIAERIGEQKIILNDILILLKNFSDDSNFASFITDLEMLKEAYKDVIITYEKGEQERVEKDGMLVIYQNETNHVDIKDAQLQDIIKKTETIRNKLIGIK